MNKKHLLACLSSLLILGSALQADETDPLEQLTNKTELFGPFRSNYEMADHEFEYISQTTHCVCLDDDTQWKAENLNTVKRWREGNQIWIMADRGWKEAVDANVTYLYRLANKDKNSSVAVNPFLGPKMSKSKQLICFDPERLYGSLTDGSEWMITREDADLFQEWRTGHTVIIGIYDRWFTSYDYILINVDLNHYIRAKHI